MILAQAFRHRFRDLGRGDPKSWEQWEQAISSAVVDGALDGEAELPGVLAWLVHRAKAESSLEPRVVVGIMAATPISDAVWQEALSRAKAADTLAAAKAQLARPSESARIAGARVLAHIKGAAAVVALQECHATEQRASVRAVIEDALATLGAKPAPTSGLILLAANATRSPEVQARLDAAIRGAGGFVVPFDELADAAGLDAAAARAELAALVRDSQDDLQWHHNGVAKGGRALGRRCLDTVKSIAGIAHLELEKLVHEREHAALEAALANAPAIASPAVPKSIAITWADGTALGTATRGWLLGLMFSTEVDSTRIGARNYLLGLIAPLLTSASATKLASWSLRSKKKHGQSRVLPTDSVVDQLAGAWETGELSTPLWELPSSWRTDAFQRWRYRWWRTQHDPAIREALRFAYAWPWSSGAAAPEAVIDRHWPDTDDASGSAAEWMRWIAQTLEFAMVQQRQIPGHVFRRRYLANALVRSALQGVVLAIDDALCWVDAAGQLCDAGGPRSLLGHATVRVAHPLLGTERWPDLPAPAFAQRERAVFTQPPPAVPRVGKAEWFRRCRSLGYSSSGEQGEYLESSRGAITIHHAIGDVPARYSIKGPSTPVLVSEAIYDLRRLAGIDPITDP